MKKDTILQIIANHDWDGLTRMFDSLSNMDFRRTEKDIRMSILPQLENDLFWETYLHLIIYRRQAFLTGVLCIEHLIRNNTLNYKNDSVKALYSHLKETNPETIVKIANLVFPYLTNETQVNELFEAFHIDNDITRISVLLKTESPLSYYIIYKTLKIVDDKFVATKTCKVLMKRNNDMAYNATSLIKTYFALNDLPARFSLNIPEFELNHIDKNYENFLHVLNGKRPNI